MARIPQLPNTGQPIDTQYIYEIVESLISLNTQLSKKSSSKTNVYANGLNYNTYQASDLGIASIQSEDITYSKPANPTTVTKEVPFGMTFKYPPMVSTGIVANDNNTVNNTASCVIASINTNSVTLRITATAGAANDLSVRVNVLAIGIPA